MATSGNQIEKLTGQLSSKLVTDLYFSDLYHGTSINTEILRDHLRQEGRLSEELALKIIRDGKKFVFWA